MLNHKTYLENVREIPKIEDVMELDGGRQEVLSDFSM